MGPNQENTLDKLLSVTLKDPEIQRVIRQDPLAICFAYDPKIGRLMITKEGFSVEYKDPTTSAKTSKSISQEQAKKHLDNPQKFLYNLCGALESRGHEVREFKTLQSLCDQFNIKL